MLWRSVQSWEQNQVLLERRQDNNIGQMHPMTQLRTTGDPFVRSPLIEILDPLQYCKMDSWLLGVLNIAGKRLGKLYPTNVKITI